MKMLQVLIASASNSPLKVWQTLLEKWAFPTAGRGGGNAGASLLELVGGTAKPNPRKIS